MSRREFIGIAMVILGVILTVWGVIALVDYLVDVRPHEICGAGVRVVRVHGTQAGYLCVRDGRIVE